VPLLALIAIFVVIPLAELYVIFEVVGPALGAPLTIALLAVDSLAGAWLMKSQGRAVWGRFNEDRFWEKHNCILTEGSGQPPRGVEDARAAEERPGAGEGKLAVLAAGFVGGGFRGGHGHDCGLGG